MTAVAPPLARAVCRWPPEDEAREDAEVLDEAAGADDELGEKDKSKGGRNKRHANKAVPEWAMIELQGTLVVARRKDAEGENIDFDAAESGGESEDETSAQEGANESLKRKKATMIKLEHHGLQGQTLGALSFENGVPILEIGVHRLEGKVTTIAKPFAIIERMADEEGVAPQEAPTGGGEVEDALPTARFAVRGIIRQKLLFKTRPKPLVGKRARFV